MTSADFDLNAGYQMLANLAAATEPAAKIDGGQWNPLTIPLMPDARGQTLTIGRTFQFDGHGVVFAYALGRRLGAFPQHEAARAAIEEHAASVLAGPVPVEDHLFAADMLALISDFVTQTRCPEYDACEVIGPLLRRADEIIAAAQGKGLRAQSFADRERDLLAANARFEENARAAEARSARSLGLAETAQDTSQRLLQKLEDAQAKLVAISALLDRELARNVMADAPIHSKVAEPQGRLCYVRDRVAYFTTADITGPLAQWGDDWNDKPYEHNAGTPYRDQGVIITEVPFLPGRMGEPCANHFNSPWSVEQINAGATPWLSTLHNEDAGNPISIPAGASFAEFQAALVQAGGTALMPWQAVAPVVLRRVKHLKRGTTYEVLGEAEAQVARSNHAFSTDKALVLTEGDTLIVYRCEQTGKLWLRHPDEFADGRFEEIAEERAA